jgi:DNA repair protein RecN (Recombination protein N)
VLTQLHIQGLAIIDSLTIHFVPGFNVITGETGAGKSILIKALGLLLGAKASAETVRRGRSNATVSGFFDIPADHPYAGVLEHYGIGVESADGVMQVLVRRTVTDKGRSLAWINDTPVTVTVLRELALSLIDVFGQHDNLRLLDAVQHVTYLDQFLIDKALPRRFSAAYQLVLEELHVLSAMAADFSAKRRDCDYLNYRCEELAAFAPSQEDFDRVQDLCRRGHHMMALVKGLEEAQGAVDQGAGGDSLARPVWDAGKILGRLATLSPVLAELSDQAQSVAAQIEELSFSIGKALSEVEVDDQDLEQAQERLAGYQELLRKLSLQQVSELLSEQERLSSELGFLQSAAAEVGARLKQLKVGVVGLAAAAAQLSEARRQAQGIVKMRIEKEMHELAMPGATMEVELIPLRRTISDFGFAVFGAEAAEAWAEIADILTGLGEQGAEKAQFMLAANEGEAMLPLHKIASGGEISRVMLALKKALAVGADTCILVFDEIDAGISGRVADVVGRKMQELATDFQVICISHLAQVAAYGDAHFFVHKLSKDQRTESTITKLSLKASEEEIARLLSGAEVTASSLANARGLLKKARLKQHAL